MSVVSTIGNGLQILAMISLLGAIANSNNQYGKKCLYLSSYIIIISFISLIYAFIISDFTILNVFLHSSTIKPLKFKIAASWASHEGSMLLWLALISSITIIYLSSKAFFHYYQICILATILLLFSSFVYFTSNPFMVASLVAKEGLGLNPSLQDIALVIHPPILYLGYVCTIVPFVNSYLIILKAGNNSDYPQYQKLMQSSKNFITYALIAMSSGILLGAWWAYRELGWGGYWFFDPVENISLLPWFSTIALYHCLPITNKTGKLFYSTIILSISSFLLVVLGIFLVRSGLIVSVHAFAVSNQRASYLLFILLFLLGISVIILIKAIMANSHELNTNKLVFKEKIIYLGNFLWILATLVLIASVIYPIMVLLVKNKVISIDINYFIKIFIPICLLCAVVAALHKANKHSLTYIIFITLGTVITYSIKLWLSLGYIESIAVFVSIVLALQNISSFFHKSYNIARVLGHLAFAGLIFSCAINNATQVEVDFIGKIGDKINNERFEIKLNNVKFARTHNYYKQTAEFLIEDKASGHLTVLRPENRFYVIEKALSQESDIYSYLTHDLYAILYRIDEEVIHARIYYRPMISFIWLSVIGIIASFVIAKLRKTPVKKLLSVNNANNKYEIIPK